MRPLLAIFILVVSSCFAAEPEKLTKLRGSYQAALDKVTAPIQRTYATELEKLKIEFTKAGKLEDALSVDQEIKSLGLTPTTGTSSETRGPSRSMSDFTSKRAFEKWVIDSRWTTDSESDESLTISKTSIVFTAPNGGPTKSYAFEITKIGEVTWKYGNGQTNRLTISEKLDSAVRLDESGFTCKYKIAPK